MAKSTNGIRFLQNLEIGYDAMQWWQAEMDERARWFRIASSHECGWIGEWVGGNPSFGWELYDSGSGVLAIRSTGSDGTPMFFGKVRGSDTIPVMGVDRAGHILEQANDTTLTDSNDDDVVAANDGTWRTLVATYRVRQREPGTLSITGGSTTVTGVGTQFTRYSGASDEGGATVLRISTDDSIQGNEGSYAIATITDDENMTLATAPPATETGVEFRVKGSFFSSTPADPDAHNNPAISWSLETRTTTRPTEALIVADVKRSGGTTTIIDRRRANVWRPISSRARGCTLMLASQSWDNIDGTAGGGPGDSTALSADVPALVLKSASATTASMIAMSLAPASTGSDLSGLATDMPTGLLGAFLFDDNGTRKLQVYAYTVLGDSSIEQPNSYAGEWQNPDGGSATYVVSTGGTLDAHLLALPVNSGSTHLALYINSSGLLKSKFSTDNGATWGVEATVWDPTSTETVSKVSAVLTRMGRIVVACAYSTGNRIRYIYSDDYGATWDTNSNNGYSSSAAGEAAVDVAIVETDDGTLWTIAAVTSTNGLRLYRGASEGSPLPDAAEQTSGWKVGLDSASLDTTYVDAVPMPDGTLAVVYGATDNSSDNGLVGYIHIGRRYPLYQQRLVVRPLSANVGIQNVPVCVGVMASGHICVGFGNTYVTSSTNYNVAARLAFYAPVELARPLLPYGGL